jgi:hypothetical protein
MLISPPFLPTRGAAQSESDWLDAAMAPAPSRLPDTHAAEGSYPLSHGLAWHNGVHLQAPAGSAVLAIADGVIRYVHQPAQANETATDPQNYSPFPGPEKAWTDNGCVIIEHTTTIGGSAAAGAAETSVVFYSLYMHLSQIGHRIAPGQSTGPLWAVGNRIYRKDEVGMPGQIYGAREQIHFEVCFTQAQLQHMIGRAPAWADPAVAPAAPPAPTADGRIDSVFGSLYFYLSASTPTQAGTTAPTQHMRRAGGGTLGQAIWVKMTYDQGGCQLESFTERGVLIDRMPVQSTEEHDLYQEAVNRHDSLTSAEKANSSPSGWYELLRFGRNLGRGPAATDKDRLPHNGAASAAHWRYIMGPANTPLWADLNAAGSFKFSDADFLAVMGWNFFNDDTDHDNQLCDSQHLKEFIRDPDANNANRMAPEQLAARLGDATVRQGLRRAICQFPTEWAQSTALSRYKFAEAVVLDAGADADLVKRFQAHLNAMTFSDLPAGYLTADWRIHPREFIEQWRKCGWLSHNELVQCIPRNSPAGGVPLATATARINTWGVTINSMTRKFMLNSALRLTHLLAHVWAETGYLRLTREGGADAARYAPYIGRGLIQITWEDKYVSYNKFARITLDADANFNLELIATDAYHAGNSSGFYWVSKDIKEPRNVDKTGLSHIADAGSTTDTIGKLCLWINGGGNHYDHRHIHFYFIQRVLDDKIYRPVASFPLVQGLSFNKMRFVRETRIRNGQPVQVIVGTESSNVVMNLRVDHTPQRP